MTTSRTIKVRIPVTVEIDMAAWDDVYGGGTATEIREDVKRYVQDLVRQQLAGNGMLADA